MEELNSVQKFYSGKTIFITGASGYMGKVLLEKFLYSCSDLKSIIILMREKRGMTAQQRVEKFKTAEVFKRRLLVEKPETFVKINPVYGELTKPDFGLSPEDLKKVVETSDIFIHNAASLKNEAPLRYNVINNLVGTKYALELAKKMKNLLHFQHVSTAFCNIEPEKVIEKVYGYHHDPEDLIRMSEWMSDDAMKAVQKDLMGDFPNTYLYTKRLAEILVEKYYPSLPVCIVRPTAVMPSFSEPFPGWVDSLNGIVGIFVAGSRGVLRSVLADRSARGEFIPVDTAINGMIMAAKEMSTVERWKEIPVFTLTCDDSQKLLIGETFDQIRALGDIYPVTWAIWYPNGGPTSSVLLHKMRVFFFQMIPAYFFDFLLFCFGQKTLLVHVQKRIAVGLEVLQFFLMRPWYFHQTNYQSLIKSQSPSEYEMFKIDIANFKNQENYIENCILGGREHCCFEPPSTIPRARIINKIQYVIHMVCQFLFYWFVITYMMKAFGIYEPLKEFFSSSSVFSKSA